MGIPIADAWILSPMKMLQLHRQAPSQIQTYRTKVKHKEYSTDFSSRKREVVTLLNPKKDVDRLCERCFEIVKKMLQ